MSFPTFYQAAKNTIATGQESLVNDPAEEYRVNTRNLNTQDRDINRITTRAAIAILKENEENLKKHPDDKESMQKLVRAYNFLRTQEVRIIHKHRNPLRLLNSHLRGSIREYNENIKTAERAMLNRFDTYLSAHKLVAKTSELESKLSSHLLDIEFNLEAFGVKKEFWNKVKEHIVHNDNDKANEAWNALLDEIQRKGGKQAGHQNLKDRAVVEGLLLGTIDYRNLIIAKGPDFAKFNARFEELEKISTQSPELRKLWIKTVVAAVKGDNKKLAGYVRRMCKLANNNEIKDYFFQKQNPLSGNIRKFLLIGSYNTIFGNLSHSANKLLTSLQTFLQKQKKPDTSTLGRLNFQKIALGNQSYIASAAPKTSKEAEAYFDKLEKENTQIIVDLKGDFERKMKNFNLIPEVEGEEITLSRNSDEEDASGTKIKLLEKKDLPVEGAWNDVQYLTDIRVRVTRPDGQIKEYRILKLNNWEESSPPDLVALRSLSKAVKEAKHGNHGTNIAAHCADGFTRTATFLMYHHWDSSNITQPIDIYVDYNRLRPTVPPLKANSSEHSKTAHDQLMKEQLAALTGAACEENATFPTTRVGLVHPNQPKKTPSDIILGKLYHSEHNSALKLIFETNPIIRAQYAKDFRIADMNNTDQILATYLKKELENFLVDLPPSAQHEIALKIKQLNEVELSRLFFFLHAGIPAKELMERASPYDFFNFFKNDIGVVINKFSRELKKYNSLGIDPISAFLVNFNPKIESQSSLHSYVEIVYNAMKRTQNTFAEKLLRILYEDILNQFSLSLESEDFNIESYLEYNDHFTPYFLRALSPKVLATVYPGDIINGKAEFVENLSSAHIQALSDAQILAILEDSLNPNNGAMPYIKKLPSEMIARLPRDSFTTKVIEQLLPSQLLAYVTAHPVIYHSDALDQEIFRVAKQTPSSSLDVPEKTARLALIKALKKLDILKQKELNQIFNEISNYLTTFGASENPPDMSPLEQIRFYDFCLHPSLQNLDRFELRQLLKNPKQLESLQLGMDFSPEEKRKFSEALLLASDFTVKYMGGSFQRKLNKILERTREIDWSTKAFSSEEAALISSLFEQTQKLHTNFPLNSDYTLIHTILNVIKLGYENSSWDALTEQP